MSTLFTAESLRGITQFVVTAQSSSFTEAAVQLGLSKSAIGKSIARLESRLGTRLFHRSTRKLSLTSDGEAYYESCIAALEILNSAEHAFCRRQDIPTGTVRIDMPVSFGRQLMMPLLISIAKDYPDLRLALTFNDSIVDPVESGCDLVLRLGKLRDTDELIARHLGSQPLLLCASPAYLSHYGSPLSIASLKQHTCLMGFRRGAPLAWRLKAEKGEEIRFSSSLAHEISDGDALVQACVAGLGIAQFPELMIQDAIHNGTLVPLLEHCRPEPSDLSLVWPRAKHLFPKVRLIVDALVAKSETGCFG